MSPSLFFLVTLGVTVVALALQAILRRIHRRKLQRLASEWSMHYSPDDRFRLAGRVAEMLPIPGAAQVRVMDLIYGNEKDGYRYLFSASFTEGVIRTKRRSVRVASFRETRDRDCADSASPLLVAEEHLPIVEQYRELQKKLSAQKAVSDQPDKVSSG